MRPRYCNLFYQTRSTCSITIHLSIHHYIDEAPILQPFLPNKEPVFNHHSSLTIHLSLFISHYSSLTIHLSLFISHYSYLSGGIARVQSLFIILFIILLMRPRYRNFFYQARSPCSITIRLSIYHSIHCSILYTTYEAPIPPPFVQIKEHVFNHHSLFRSLFYSLHY
jgi:hypothetical protein